MVSRASSRDKTEYTASVAPDEAGSAPTGREGIMGKRSSRPRRKKCTPLRAVCITTVVILLLAGTASIALHPVRAKVLDFLAWAEAHKSLSASLYTILFAIGAVICLPEIVLAAAAGYLYSFGVGFAVVYAGGLIASVAAFSIARHLLRNWVVKNLLEDSPWLQEIDRALSQNGLKLAILVRLPYVPFVQMNYIFGITPLTYRQYILATVVGTIPGAALYVFVGTGLKSITQYLEGHESAGPIPMILTITGFVTAVCTFVGVAVYARRKVKEAAATAAQMQGLLDLEGSSGSTAAVAASR